MAEDEARVRDLREQLYQLDVEARGSALTPGEAEKNRDAREAVLAELRALGEAETPPAAAGG